MIPPMRITSPSQKILTRTSNNMIECLFSCLISRKSLKYNTKDVIDISDFGNSNKININREYWVPTRFTHVMKLFNLHLVQKRCILFIVLGALH